MKKSLVMISVMVLAVLGAAQSSYAAPMVDVNIVFTNSINDQFLNQINAEVKHRYDSFEGVAVEMPSSAVAQLDNQPFVDSWEYDQEVQLLEDSIDWGVDRVNAERVWGGFEDAVDVTGTCGTSVKVAVIDTGIDMDHSDLNVLGGYDFVNNDNNPNDGNGHGTHVAGTISALDNEAGLVGVAPCVELYGVKVLSNSGSGTSADVAAGIEWAGDNGMDIASLSLGSSSGSSVIQNAGEYAASQGVLLVAASGNDGAGSVGYPAAFAEFIAVGATDSSDNIASFSNRGSAMEISAPGVNIQSTWNNGGYNTISGTSMATPHVSAVAALVMSADTTLSAGEVRTILQNTADDRGSSGWDSTYGYGIVNAEAAVDAANGGGGGGGDDTDGGTLENGVTVTDLLTSSSDSDQWTLDVGADATSIRVQLDSGSNDFDFFAADYANPTHSNNIFEGYTSGGEDVTYTGTINAGTWYFVVDQYSGTGSYDLTVTVTYDDGGGGTGDVELSIYTYDWDISGEADLIVNGVELNWEAQGLAADGGYKTYTFDISDIAGTTVNIDVIDTFGSYTNYFRDLIIYVDGVEEVNLQTSWIDPDGSGESYSYSLDGGGGSDTFSLSLYTYDWDISGEVDLIVNGVELNWEAQGLSADGGYKTYTFDITSIAGSSLTIELIDTFGSYTNYFTDLIVYRNGVAESNLESSWVETPGSGVSYTYNL